MAGADGRPITEVLTPPTPDTGFNIPRPSSDPFYFGPNSVNPQLNGEPVQMPSQPVSPEQAQIGQLQGFLQKLQDPTSRMQLVNILGQTQPAPQDEDIAAFLNSIGGTSNAT